VTTEIEWIVDFGMRIHRQFCLPLICMVRYTGEDFINVERVAAAVMSALQSIGALGPKFITPESYGLVADCNTTFG